MYQKDLKARKIYVVYRWRVFEEQARRRSIRVLINFDEYSSIERRACRYPIYIRGYFGVDRVQNAANIHEV